MGVLSRSTRRHALAYVCLSLACVPEFESDLSLVEAPRVLALRSEPAEAAPGEAVTVSALVAGPDGTLAETELDWSLCLARRPLTSLAPIAPECAALVDDEEVLDSLGTGTSLTVPLPPDACRRFGPEPPAAVAGEPTGRPVDADPTGGYFQPILARLLDDDSVNLLQTRITCGLAGATQAQAAEFSRRHQANLGPAVERVEIVDGDGELLSADPPAPVVAGASVELRVAWTGCPVDAVCGDELCSLDELELCADDCELVTGCPGAETHVYFDPITLEVATRREAISVAWYTTAGRLDHARTGRGSADLEATSDNRWTAPVEPGLVWFWAVLRDDRGGVGWTSFVLEVE